MDIKKLDAITDYDEFWGKVSSVLMENSRSQDFDALKTKATSLHKKREEHLKMIQKLDNEFKDLESEMVTSLIGDLEQLSEIDSIDIITNAHSVFSTQIYKLYPSCMDE